MTSGKERRHWRNRLLGAAALVTATAAFAPSADASADPASQLVSYLNAERSAAGLAPVTAYWDLEDDARRHAQKMARDGRTSAMPNIEGVTSGWSSLSEFEGTGMSPEEVHRTAMAQANFHQAVFGHYDHVGIGVARGENGRMWVAVVLMQVAPCAK